MNFNGSRANGESVPGWRDRGLAARDHCVLELLPLARSVARRYAGGPERLDDLEQVAIVGAVKAASRFDPARGTPLAQFAVPFIHGELRHHLRDNLGLPRGPRATQANAAKVIRAATAISGRVGRPARRGGDRPGDRPRGGRGPRHDGARCRTANHVVERGARGRGRTRRSMRLDRTTRGSRPSSTGTGSRGSWDRSTGASGPCSFCA